MTWFFKHVQTCPDLSWYYDTIWYYSTNMSRHVIMIWYDLIWYDSTNMSRHVLIRFYKHVQTFPDMSRHVQTCHNIMIQFDMILQTCPNLSLIRFDKILYVSNMFEFLMSQTCLNLSWTLIWQNFMKSR